MQQQAGACLAFHVATTEDIAQKLLAGLIDYFGCSRKLSGFEDADNDARAALLFRASAFYAKFQNIPLSGGWKSSKA
jgi:hypothetical protein